MIVERGYQLKAVQAKCRWRLCRKGFTKKSRSHLFCSRQCKKSFHWKKNYNKYFSSTGKKKGSR